MPKKIEKKLKRKVASKVVKLKVEEPKKEVKAGSVIEPALPPPVAEPVAIKEFLPEGVFKKEVVDLNGRKYNKYYRKDGTTNLELLG